MHWGGIFSISYSGIQPLSQDFTRLALDVLASTGNSIPGTVPSTMSPVDAHVLPMLGMQNIPKVTAPTKVNDQEYHPCFRLSRPCVVPAFAAQISGYDKQTNNEKKYSTGDYPSHRLQYVAHVGKPT